MAPDKLARFVNYDVNRSLRICSTLHLGVNILYLSSITSSARNLPDRIDPRNLYAVCINRQTTLSHARTLSLRHRMSPPHSCPLTWPLSKKQNSLTNNQLSVHSRPPEDAQRTAPADTADTAGQPRCTAPSDYTVVGFRYK